LILCQIMGEQRACFNTYVYLAWKCSNPNTNLFYLFIQQTVQCFHNFLRQFNNYTIFFLQVLLSFHSSSINPFPPICPLIPTAQISLGRFPALYFLKYTSYINQENLFIYLYFYCFIYLFIYLYIYIYLFIQIYLFIFLLFYLFVYLFIYLIIFIFIYLF